MQIKLLQCPISGAVQFKLNAAFDRTHAAHIKFKKMIKDHAFEWDFEQKVWEGCVNAIEDILDEEKHMAVMAHFIASTPIQGLSFLDADGNDLEKDDWLAWIKTFDISKVASALKDIPKATFDHKEESAGSSQQSTPVKRKFEGPPRAGGKKPAQ